MSTVLNKDKSIAAQNASTGAAAIVAALVRVGAVPFDGVTEAFDTIRTSIFEGTLMLAEEFAQPVGLAPQPAAYEPFEPIAAVGAAFPGATNVSGQPQAQAPAVGGYGQVKMQLAGQPLPEWLGAQFAQSKCTPGEDLWDNRKDLPLFGGDRNPKAPWFKGATSGEGVWPPK